MPYVPVPKDLTKVKTKLAFNLTKRQLICFSLAGLVGLPVYFFTRGAIGNRWLLPVSDVFDVDMDIRENIAGIRDSQEYLCQREPAVSVLARLQNAAQEVRECPAAEKPVRDFGAR